MKRGGEESSGMRRNKAYVYLILALVSWGSLYVAGKYVLEVLPSFTLLFSRYLIALAVLFFVYRNRPKAVIERKDYKYIAAIGLIGYFLAIGLQLLGTHYCTASMASLITSMNPAMIIVLAVFLLHEKITFRKGLAVGITLLGTGVIIGDLGTGNAVSGVIFSFASMIAWSLTSVLVRLLSQRCDSVTITIYGMTIGLLFSIPAAFVEYQITPFSLTELTPTIVLWVIYIGVVCTAGGLLFWNKALSMLPAATCSLFYPVQPLTSAVLGILILGETLNLNFIIGSALIIGGILYAVINDKRTSMERG